MVLLPTVDRNKRQDSPMLWLSLLAGSLALHLALLLIGRWYFSQPQGSPTTSTTPIEIEIAPSERNATVPERSGGSVERSSSNNTTPRSTVVVPTSPTEASSPIANSPTAPVFPDRPTPAPLKPTRRDNQTAPLNNGQQPLNQTPTGSNGGKTPSDPNSPTSGGNNTSGQKPSGTAEPTKPQSPGTAEPTKPQGPVGNGSQLPPSSNAGQGGQFALQGQLSQLSIPRSFSVQRNADRASLRSLKVPDGTITLTPADIGGEKVLKLQVRFTVNNKDGTYDKDRPPKVLNDSPIFDEHPNLDRGMLEGIAYTVLQDAEFDVNVLPGAAKDSQSDWEALLTINLSPEK